MQQYSIIVIKENLIIIAFSAEKVLIAKFAKIFTNKAKEDFMNIEW